MFVRQVVFVDYFFFLVINDAAFGISEVAYFV